MSQAAIATEPPGNWVDLVDLICNTFGIDLNTDPKVPWFKARAMQAGRLKRAGHSIEHLTIAVDYCKHHGMKITSPYGVVYQVEKALVEQRSAQRTAQRYQERSFPEDVAAAVHLEQMRVQTATTDAERDAARSWVDRLSRAQGQGLAVALAEWQDQR